VTFDFGSSLDLLHEVLSGWPELFCKHDNFRSLFQHTLCAALLPLLLSRPETTWRLAKATTLNFWRERTKLIVAWKKMYFNIMYSSNVLCKMIQLWS